MLYPLYFYKIYFLHLYIYIYIYIYYKLMNSFHIEFIQNLIIILKMLIFFNIIHI